MNAKKPTHRRAIGDDPLDVVVPSAPRRSSTVEAPTAAATRQRHSLPSPARKIRATFHIPVDLFEEARDAVVFLSGPPLRLTLASLAEHAFRLELARLKREHHKGKDFPKRAANLRGGRPIGS